MSFHRSTSLAAAAVLLAGSTALAEPNVVVSIKPLHSLVSGVMDGVATPSVIVEGAASPHTHSLRPSKARALEQADLIIWVGPQLEAFLAKPVENIGAGATVVELGDLHDLIKLPVREGATFDAHAHGDDHDEHAEHGEKHHDHAEHAEHDEKHDDHAEHAEHDEKHGEHEEHAEHEEKHDDHEEHAEHGEQHDDHAEHAEHDEKHGEHDEHAEHDDHHDEEHAGHHDDHHGEGSFDAHFWLDPQNARVVVAEVTEALTKADPGNAAKYTENAANVTARIDALQADIEKLIEPVKDKSFIVFHDAYQYFENRFGVQAAGSVTVSPEVAPGAERIAAIRDKVEDLHVRCVFSEPQFSPGLVTVVTEQTDANAAVLDPLGADIEQGPDLYFTLMENLANNMRECLSESS